ncbi:transcription elongation factor GreA [Buchnera aphidicola]|uniref:Transcription elongation factor GreA n=1 Tax=Buchnera aphidicola subsp. Uroleucon sonchi TaxID=118118 RepID=A0A6C1FHB5_BUCUN|nr:transcription elongation factor GreA [Buchnera aphidicola]QIE02085.1 transcription elongation factor GreA [Buchnera aphidicola (Uroleucon sonchi)]
MSHLIPMTARGAEKLLQELKTLKNIKRPRIIKAIAEAREHGDLKENAEYHSAREEQSFCEGRIKEIELKLSNSQIIDIKKISNTGRVIFGSTISILNINNNQAFTYKIVGDDESDFKKNLISINSPIARGLIGKNINDTVNISTPGGNVEYKILKIDHI